MSFKEWLFETGEITNEFYPGQWKFLHILTLIICVALILGFYFLYKYCKNKEKTRKIIIITLASLILFFEIMSRFVYFMRKYYFNTSDMIDLSALWIIIPKPWCAISCWALVASVVVDKEYFYNYASLSALLCSFIFFIYPGVGFNNIYIMWSNLYSIVTHALLLTMSISLITLKFTDFKYNEFWKLAICFVATFAYGLLQIFVLKTQTDPMYFMPHGDIQEGILNISWPLYITLYFALIIIYINSFYLISDKENVKNFFNKKFKKVKSEA